MSGPSLHELSELVRRFRDDRDWSQFHTPKDLAAAIAIEAAELQELFLWRTADEQKELLDERRDEIEGELADVIILALNFALAADIDVAAAIQRKLDLNAAKYPVATSRGRASKPSTS